MDDKMALFPKDIFINHPVKKPYEEDLYKVHKVPYKKDDTWLLKTLMQSRSIHSRKNSSSAGGRARGATNPRLHPKDQRVTFKTSHSSSMQAHDKYLTVYMPQNNKDAVNEKPVLFGSDAEEYESAKVAMHHKMIISPENQSVDLEVLAEEFIRRVEMMTGYKLYWRGAIHNDTAHRHVHLCINGKDKNGKKVYFQPEMIKHTMRETLSYVATQMVGERTEEEIVRAQKNMITAKRWTGLDEKLEKYHGKISGHLLSQDMQNRLAFLSKLDLAKKHSDFYELKPEWKDVLTATGRYNTFFDEYRRAEGNLTLYAGGGIKGTVEKVITFDKDESWNDALIIKQDDKYIYVPIYQLKKEDLQGKEVEITAGNRKLSRQLSDRDIHIHEEKKVQDKYL
nr:hypothetical protein [Treponema socranskii]